MFIADMERLASLFANPITKKEEPQAPSRALQAAATEEYR